MMDAQILKSDGTEEEFIFDGKVPGLEAMQEVVGGYIQMIHLDDGRVMIMNEEGKLERLPQNDKATAMTRDILSQFDVVVGDVIVMDEKYME